MTELVQRDDAVLTSQPMAWEDYLAAGEELPGEYYAGAYVAMPSPSRTHQTVLLRLRDLLVAAVPPGHIVVPEWNWSPAGRRELLIPDLMVCPPTADDVAFTGIPLLAVEVLSTNRRDDLVSKVTRYAAWGLPDYWVLDPRDRALLTFVNRDGVFAPAQRLTGGRATLRYADVAVAADVDALLAPLSGPSPRD